MSKTVYGVLLLIAIVVLGYFGYRHSDKPKLPISGEWSTGCIAEGDNSKNFSMSFTDNTYHSLAKLYQNTDCSGDTLSEYRGSAYAEVSDAHLKTVDGDEAVLLTLYWDDKTQPRPLVYQQRADGTLVTGVPQPKTEQQAGGWKMDTSAVFKRVTQ
ncbi:hypothetical protein JYB87_08410 [Shewanella avicenniae]|uniref:Lipocalin-like domain-containing protein n=1 Tax=Shewanella avicenniae TaxID=2814294 RepID=A0ABX7QW76_9GAMM|nr:hypothetical protein [Shewanella avicenniae]QSX35201.1 hypothetical protein JYB87_08410 [Shewanella avicenniae]